MAKSLDSPATAPSWPTHILNVARGALIGAAESVPGVSGGTVALMVGVYETVITSAGHLISAVRMGLTDVVRGQGFSRAADEFRLVRWSVIVPLLVGMFGALVLMASLVEGWVHDYPIQMRALFFGLVLASLWVPFSLSVRAAQAAGAAPAEARWGWRDILIALAAAVLAYVVVSLPPGEVEATPLVIVLAAAVAVSALVLPGMSGSFLLLTFGLYEQTLSAVNERDFGYLGLFLLGALVGLASIVKLLQWLLEHRERVTLVVLTGVLAGSLRALWPWQDEGRGLLAPGEYLGSAIGMAALGFALVVAVLVVERRLLRGRQQQ
ncbi:DUF368 domain-containing protein [Salinactinospora qingdaonensis]|uniref:DUF368 domain-containing protein n=1 Tax=Salinactinospora qingdaonensis TaxID=702744 RepID=UPI0031E78464